MRGPIPFRWRLWRKRASGGVVKGYDSGDSIPALLSPGYYWLPEYELERLPKEVRDRLNQPYEWHGGE